jgi:hypothetical protein
MKPAADGEATAAPDLRWWKETIYVLGFYAVYTFVRNRFGSASVGSTHAFNNAIHVIDLEKTLRIFNESTVQSWFLGVPLLLRVLNIFYGSFHFVFTASVLIWLAWRHPRAYPTWRNTILIATGLALVGFALFPLMPPRLLCDCPYGAGPIAASAGLPTFMDTLAVHGGLWSFSTSTMAAVSNQYAAMPSLHFAWALWCALVLVPRVRHRITKVLAVLYPILTLATVVITGNHYWLDPAGGAVVVGIGWLIGSKLAAVMHRGTARSDTVPFKSILADPAESALPPDFPGECSPSIAGDSPGQGMTP